MSSLVQRLKKVFSELSEIDKDNIYPLQVDVVCEQSDTKEIRMVITDARLGTTRSIDPGFVSSSIASTLMVDIVALFLSISTPRKYKVLVIKEPEEAMAPVQQVVFAMFVDEAIAKLKSIVSNNTYIILSSHSPYIVSGFANPNTYYFYYDVENKRFAASKRPPSRPFVFAEALLTVISERKEFLG